jgi:hypothetical protein
VRIYLHKTVLTGKTLLNVLNLIANAKYSALRAPIKYAFATSTISAFILGAVMGW